MIAAPVSKVHIDDVHSAAICKEIGQRLERYYSTEISSPSVELKRLLARLQQLDRRDESVSRGD